MAEAGRAFVTGGAGFVGSAVVRALLDVGEEVVALVEPGADTRNLDELPAGAVRQVGGDLRDADAVRKAMDGCTSVFHVAALYRFWAPDPHAFYEVNVRGTRSVMAAARDVGVQRVVYTSTVGTLGLDHGRPANELDFPDVGHLFGGYKRSKYVAEHEVLRAAAEGLPVSLILPTLPLGPRDRTPTPSGRIVLDFLNGRMPGYVDTTLNPVHVDDVARGHLLARDRGAVGRSYIIGGENMPMRELLATLAALTGLPAPRLRAPRAAVLAAAWVSDTVEGRLLRRTPRVPLEAARMSTTQMAFDDSRARTELGHSPRPAAEALADAARWYLDNGYVEARRRGMITLR
jgi:dihydroflavonol-4-reductase